MIIESHIHLSHHLYDGEFPYIGRDQQSGELVIKQGTREAVIEDMRKQDIAFCLEPGIDLESNGKLMQLCEKYPDFIYPAVGVHPTRIQKTRWRDRGVIEELSIDKRVVAIGELGLDYHHSRREQQRIKQKLWFIWQLKLAHRRRLPLILHIRMADKDGIRILRRYKNKLHGGVCHCFSSDWETAKVYTQELGLMLGIGGALLQEGEQCQALEEAVKNTPLEYLIMETDGPYVKPLKPDGVTGKQWKKARNTGMIIPDVAKKIADIKGISVAEVERVTSENVRRLLFGKDKA